MRDWPPKPIPHYRRAVFLDRDGTINVDTDFPYQIQTLRFIPKAIDGLRLLAALPFHIIVVSNQAGIALGIFTQQQMSGFNAELLSKVQRAGGRIDAFYFCPHLEAKHLPPGASPCECSKPSPGLLFEASVDFKLDLQRSFVIGDKTSDIAAGKTAGCVTILLQTGKAGKEEGALPIRPEHFARDLYEAAQVIQSYLKRESPTVRAVSKHTKV
jgi:D-glycero-D-manno-heptose 1,7-bisphosphate phosphatase